MSYISKEEVLKILNSYIDEEYPDPTSWATLNMIDEIKALPSLPDNSQIRELIQNNIEINRDEVYMEWKETSYTAMEYKILQELLSEIESLT